MNKRLRWRRGFAGEMAGALLTQVAAERPALASVVAFALPQNLASQGVMRGQGFVFERTIRHCGLLHLLYRKRI